MCWSWSNRSDDLSRTRALLGDVSPPAGFFITPSVTPPVAGFLATPANCWSRYLHFVLAIVFVVGFGFAFRFGLIRFCRLAIMGSACNASSSAFRLAFAISCRSVAGLSRLAKNVGKPS